MIITGLQVAGVGKFVQPTAVSGFGAGVNILSAPNEAGKSTLFRAIRTCLRVPCKTGGKAVRDLASAGRDLPLSIALDFKQDGVVWRIEKTFLRNPAARLFKNGTAHAKGDEVDEEILKILAQGTGLASSPPWGILWVEQGKSFELQKDVSLEISGTLSGMVQTEMGVLLGGERARTVLDSIITERDDLVTATGRTRVGGALNLAEKAVESGQAALEEAVAKLTALEGLLAELEAGQRELARLADPQEVARLAIDLAAARQDFAGAEGAQRMLVAAQGDAALQQSVRDQAGRALEGAEARRAAIDADRVRAAELQAGTDATGAELANVRQELAMAETALETLTIEGARDRAEAQALQKLLQATGRLDARATLRLQLERLEALEARRHDNAVALKQNPVTPEHMQRLDNLERGLNEVMARLEASSPEVTIVPGVQGSGDIMAGQVLVADRTVLNPFEPLVVRVGDRATITIVPRAANTASDRKRRAELQENLETLLHVAGVASSDEFREQHVRWQALAATRVAFAPEFKAFASHHATPAEAIAALRIEIADSDTHMRDLLSRLNRQTLPDAAELEQQRQHLEEKQEQTEKQRQGHDRRRAALNARLAGLAETNGQNAGALSEIHNRLAANLVLLPDADRDSHLAALAQTLEEARARHAMSLTHLANVQASAPTPERLQQLAIRVKRLEEATGQKKTRRVTLNQKIANLEGQIENAGGDGLGEKVSGLEQDAALSLRLRDRLAERVAVLTLLKETIEGCFSQQRTLVQAPLVRHLQPLLGDVFPGADLDFDDGLSISGLRRAGPEAENFVRLSDGTREQIAVLVRLAMGALISENGPSVPIILDDALAFSDDTRLDRMFDALGRAAATQQVIILTCRTQAFARLGGNMLAIETNDQI